MPKNTAQWPADKVERRSVADLVPYARNARTHSPEQVDQIAASIREWGWTSPVLVDEDGGIIAGHGRVLAAKKLGLTEIPVMVARGWTQAQKRAYVLADNKLALNAGWDTELLKVELAELSDLDFDMPLIGFSELELSDLLAETTTGLTDPDEVPEPPVNPVSILGDVWLLGKHRLVCGDSLDWSVVDGLLEGKKADMVFADPPYGLQFQSGMSKGGTATRFDKLANDDKILEIEPNISAALRNDGAMFIWTSHQVYPQWRKQFDAHYKHTIVWHKPGGGIGDLKGNYATDYEFCIFGVKGKVKFRGNRGMAVWTVGKDRVIDYRHPTQKPVELAVRAIEDFTDPNYIVFDPFGGSGSTLIACEQTGRCCRMIELEPGFCDVIIERFQNFTGKESRHADGRSFAELSAIRRRSFGSHQDRENAGTSKK